MTVSRLFLTPFFLLTIWRASATTSSWFAAVLYTLVAATDYVDGRLARRLGVSSRKGRILDHTADIVFLLSALVTYSALGLVPWWVPGSIAASFMFYIFDSARRPGTPNGALHLRGSRLGHVGGVLNYALVGCLVFDQTAGFRILPNGFLSAFFVAVPIYSAASIVQRLRTVQADSGC